MADLNGTGRIIGSLGGMGQISGSITGNGVLSGGLSLPEGTVVINYDGPYEVTPRLTAQTLETQNKYMTDDVSVREIPVTYTSNLQDGLTVLVG